MAEFARVESVDALRALRAAVVKFAAAADQATVAADADVERTIEWVRRDQVAYWQHQVRRRTEAASQAKLALTHKRAFPTATGGTASIIDEERALVRAKRALEEAEAKLRASKAWGARLEKERHLYRGAMGSIRSLLERDMPAALADIDRMLDALDAYLAEETPDSTPLPPAGTRAGGEPAGPTQPPPTIPDHTDPTDEPGDQ